MVPVIKDRCWLLTLCSTTQDVFRRPPQQQGRPPTCSCLWTSSENGREAWRGIYWWAAWPSCPPRVRGDSADLRESHSRPWRRELCIWWVKSHDSAGRNAAGKLAQRLVREQLLPLRSCRFTLITPNCIFMPALLCLLLKFYCAVSFHNPHSKCISPEFISHRHLPADPAYRFAAVYGEKKIKSNRERYAMNIWKRHFFMDFLSA